MALLAAQVIHLSDGRGETPAAAPISAGNNGDMASYRRKIPGTTVEFEMVAIPGGSFLIGSPAGEADRNDDEGPQTSVSVEPFWMGAREVTWAEYRQYMAMCETFAKFDELKVRQLMDKHDVDGITAPSTLYDPTFTYAAGGGPRQPAVTMSQYAAKQFTKWLSLLTGEFYRLPIEAEWEYACRAGSSTAYEFGEDAEALSDYAWYDKNSDWQTHDVGTRKPNRWGLYDMYGNASEWVIDEYRADWYATVADSGGQNVVCWPTQLYPRVLRGGSWALAADACRSASRRPSNDDDWRAYDPNSPQSPWWFASEEAQDVGFRVVRPLNPPPRDQWSRYWDADIAEIQDVADHRIDEEGRGERGRVDPKLPEAIKRLDRLAEEASDGNASGPAEP